MPDPGNRPVIFPAFANDRDDTVGCPRNLPEEAPVQQAEARGISDELQHLPAERP
jgi:hypothetical protein